MFDRVALPQILLSWLGEVRGGPGEPTATVEKGGVYPVRIAGTARAPVRVTVTDLWPGQYLEICLTGTGGEEAVQQWFFADEPQGATAVTVVTRMDDSMGLVSAAQPLPAEAVIVGAIDHLLDSLAVGLGRKPTERFNPADPRRTDPPIAGLSEEGSPIPEGRRSEVAGPPLPPSASAPG